MVRTLGVGGSEATLGRSAPGGPPMTAGEPDFLWRKSEERTPGRKRFFLPGPTFSSLGRPCGGPPSFFACPAAHLSYARNGPPPGWAGWEGWFYRREGAFLPPKPSPWGEGGPAKPGRMRGRSSTQPFLVEIKKGGSRLSPQRNFSPAPLGNPVAPSSVTFGDSFPPRGSLWVVQPSTKKRPKSGHADGYRISPSTVPLRPTTPKPASGNERPLNRGGRGASPRDSLRPGFL